MFLNTRAIFLGLVGSLAMLAILGFSRLFNLEVEAPKFTVRDVETASLIPPPPPPLEEPPPELTPPPPPALTQVSALQDPTRIMVPKAELPMDIKAPVENFYADLPPPPLPSALEPQPTSVRPTIRPPQPPSHIDVRELDGMPKLLSHGSAVFPSSLARRGVRRGTVVLEVEIAASGAVSIRRVISSTHQDLVASARRVAAPARFTPPEYKGRAVKAVMRWPIIIKK